MAGTVLPFHKQVQVYQRSREYLFAAGTTSGPFSNSLPFFSVSPFRVAGARRSASSDSSGFNIPTSLPLE
jgi:hypothetical protein